MARKGLKIGSSVNIIRSNVSHPESYPSSAIFWNTGKILKKSNGRYMVEVLCYKLWFDDEAISLAD